ncbi:MAG: hypothetical protein EOM06_12420, partial [Sphingobacteriia bacterium]|nr:hypothetical protein [Sphingobacteriia bacterium]
MALKNYIYCLFVFIAVSFSISLTGQNLKQKGKLTEFAKMTSTQFTLDKNEAISLAVKSGLMLRNKEEDGTVWELMKIRNKLPVYFTTFNAEGAEVIKSDRVYPGGSAGLSLTGSGQTLGIWDEAKVLQSHQELSGRVTQKDSPEIFSDHATHVAGTMMASGINATAKGMSYMADLDAYDWNNDESEMANAAVGGLKVSQHSYGEITGWYNGDLGAGSNWYWLGDISISSLEDYRFGFYDEGTHNVDEISFNAPHYLIVKSAGNDRNDNPGNVGHYVWITDQWVWSTDVRYGDGENDFDCIPVVGTAKNVLTVGAVNNTGEMAVFSSWGPTDDGRIKPDIVAKGVSVYSAGSANNTAYVYKSGTSMSGPMVSGSIGLLLHHQENLHPGTPLLSSTIKALILHTADDLGNPGPDYSFGWGMMNTENAASIITENAAKTGNHIYELTINNGAELAIPLKSNGIEALKATLVWTDVPHDPQEPTLNATDPMLVNDLDLRITRANGVEYKPCILDPSNPSFAATTGDNFRDNVEIINIESPETELIYMLTISHKGNLSGCSQQFSLIITGNELFDYTLAATALDESSNYSAWYDESSGGYGFNSWKFSSGGAGGSYLGVTGLGNSTFGIYSGGSTEGDYFVAQRDFEEVIPVSSTFSINLGYTDVALGGNIGISLFSGAVFRLTFKFVGGNTEWVVNDGGSDFATGIPWSENTPLNFQFTRKEGNTYSLIITQGIYTFIADDYTSSSGEMSVSRIEIFTSKQGAMGNIGFDSLSVKTGLNSVSPDVSLVINEDIEISEDLILDNLLINGGKNLLLNAGTNLTVNIDLANFNNGTKSSDGLVIESNALGTGSLIHSTAGVHGTFERYLNNADWSNWQDGWHFISPPVASQAISPNFTTDPPTRYDFYLWNEPTSEWVNFKNQSGGSGTAPFFDVVNGSNSFTVGRGYMAAFDTEDVKSFSGELNVADVPVSGLGITGTSDKSWHLIGNPFSSAITWDATTAWGLTNIAGVAKIWNELIQSYSDLTSSPSSVIPATNGFMVQVVEATGSLTIPATKRAHSAQAFYKSAVSGMMLTAKSLTAGNAQEARIVINPDATTGFDLMFDSEFLAGHAPSFYSLSGEYKLSTNSIPVLTAETEIPFAFIKNAGSQFSIEASDFEEIPGIPYLIDLKSGTSHNLADNPVYNFTAVEGDNSDRFLLKFGMVGVGENPEADNTSIYVSGQTICL